MCVPATLTRSNANTSWGNARKISTTRMIRPSFHRPAYAAVTPNITPRMTPNAVAPAATASSSPPPASTRLRTSRPSTSPPSSPLPEPGGPNVCPTETVGSCGAMNGPMIANSTTKPDTGRPAGPGEGWGATHAASSSRHPPSWGRQQRHHVGDDVDEDVEGSQDKNDELDHRDVPIADRVDERGPDPGVVEHVLHDDDSTGEIQEVEAHDLHDRG